MTQVSSLLSGSEAHSEIPAGTARRNFKVLHIVPAPFGTNGVIGGAERYAFELARHMAIRADTTLLTFGPNSTEQRVDQLRVRTVPTHFLAGGQKNNPVSFRALPEILRADVVHCHQQHVLASSSAALACRIAGRKVVVSELGGGGWDLSAYVHTDRWFHKHLHISEYSRKYYGHGQKPWAHVIYGGVDTAKFRPDPAVRRGNTVVFVGRLLPHKGVDDLIKALPDSMALEIIGQPYDQEFVARLHKLAVGKNVQFRHDCGDRDIINAYQRAICVVLPSVYKTSSGYVTGVPELLGQTLLEGMSCGAPAICTDVASMPEIVVDGKTGWVVPPNDPETLGERLRWLSERPGRVGAMGQAGRQRVLDHFTWPTVVEHCLDLYQS